MSKPVFSWKRSASTLARAASMSSPPSLPMPLLLISSKMPWWMRRMVTSRVPPPKS